MKKKKEGKVLFTVGDMFSDALLRLERGECRKKARVIIIINVIFEGRFNTRSTNYSSTFIRF